MSKESKDMTASQSQMSAESASAEPSAARGFDPATMTKDEKSIVLYLETCAVDAGGLVEGVRMNAEDHENIARLKKAGLMLFDRIPASLLGAGPNPRWTHVVHFAAAGWSLAHQLRRLRANHIGPYGKTVIAELAERGKWPLGLSAADTSTGIVQARDDDKTAPPLPQSGGAK